MKDDKTRQKVLQARKTKNTSRSISKEKPSQVRSVKSPIKQQINDLRKPTHQYNPNLLVETPNNNSQIPYLLKDYLYKKTTSKFNSLFNSTFRRYFVFDLNREEFFYTKTHDTEKKTRLYTKKQIAGYNPKVDPKDVIKDFKLGFTLFTIDKKFILFTNDTDVYNKWMRTLHYYFYHVDLLQPEPVKSVGFENLEEKVTSKKVRFSQAINDTAKEKAYRLMVEGLHLEGLKPEPITNCEVQVASEKRVKRKNNSVTYTKEDVGELNANIHNKILNIIETFKETSENSSPIKAKKEPVKEWLYKLGIKLAEENPDHENKISLFQFAKDKTLKETYLDTKSKIFGIDLFTKFEGFEEHQVKQEINTPQNLTKYIEDEYVSDKEQEQEPITKEANYNVPIEGKMKVNPSCSKKQGENEEDDTNFQKDFLDWD